ncbi:2-phospho-L-lactate guanylyltransferase [Nocardioides sp.]|uniref:2-phospho-L-lactate guanylyltransferase n=1 Tax=Nocardioides sp. TaxID=35761 RepID=UPI00356A51FC
MFVALVPVKPPAVGKSRLAELADDDRRALAAAFALDTVEACHRAALVTEVLGITDDAGFAAELTAVGCAMIPDGTSHDLNATLRLAAAEARRRWPDLLPAALLGDVPALKPDELDAALRNAAEDLPAFVADADGFGTTLFASTHDTFDPRFGPGSAAAHGAIARAIADPLPGLRRDIDDLNDLRAAWDLGLGPRTKKRAASLLGDGPPTED